MNKTKNFLDNIANLLPEGINEDTLAKIASLLSDKINEEVSNEIELLTNKVRAFFRNNVEKLKEQALKELELENDTFRNSQVYETIRSMLALEVTGEDEVNGAGILASMNESQEQKIETLSEEINRLAKENVSLQRGVKVLKDRNLLLAESIEKLNENSKVSNGIKDQKKFSDSAIIVTAEDFKKGDVISEQEETPNGNEWLTKGVLNAARTIGIGK